jgi:transposase InsO family protein
VVTLSVRTGSQSALPDQDRHLFDEPTRRLYDNAVMEAFFSSVKSETADRLASCSEAMMELFDHIEVFYNQRRRHLTLGQISPAAFERRATQVA